MADENKPAFYPRVGRTIAKNFRSAQPAPFIDDPRAMELPVTDDLSVPTRANLDMSRRIAEREAGLRKQVEADRSPLEKVAGALEAVRFMGSALTQSINSLPTRIAKGDEAADKFMQERIYKPTQPTAYEYAQDIGDFLERLETEYKLPPVATGEILGFAPLMQAGVADAARKGTGAAVRGGMALERSMAPAVTRALERGGLQRDLLLGLGQGTQSNVIKPKNGNWFGTSVQDAMSGLKRGIVDEEAARRLMGDDFVNERMADPIDQALNKWVDSNLTNYVKKQMATPEDPVRKLAEEGIVHIPTQEVGINRYRAPRHRELYEGEQLGQSEAAKAWEDASDVAINAPKVEILQAKNFLDRNPWIKDLPMEQRVYALNNPASSRQEITGLGFDHILDVLREDIASGRIRPEQLNKVSMEQAVRRTFEYDQELAKKMNEARATARAELPVFKEYPEGYRWIELNKPGSFASESEAMGHSVRGYEPPKGHPDWMEGSGDSGHLGYGYGGWEGIKSGRAKVYSLVDSKGQPHVTIETKAPDLRSNYDELQPLQRQADLEADAQNFQTFAERDKFADKRYQELKAELMAQKKPEGDYRITQIKGKGNAKPKEDYLPFVQDFVKGGNWADVGDFKNTGFEWHATGPQGIFMQEDVKALEQAGHKVPKYLTTAEKDDLARKLYEMQTGNDYNTGLPKVPPAPEMKRGGKVSISNNPDTMMLELGNQKMKNGVPAYGGAGAVIKQGLKAAKPEIMKASEALGKIEGRPLLITQADRTKVGGGYLGGPGFSGLQLTDPEYRAAEAAWAVKNPGTAKTILGGNRAAGKDAVFAAMLGSPTQHQSNQMVFDKLYGEFKKAAKRGELEPELRDKINLRLASAVDKEGNPVFPADIDILDKNFKKIADTFDRRSIAGHLMGGVQVGGKKGQIIDYDKIIKSTTDPLLIDAPSGAIGNRLFTLSGGVIERPDLHPAFPTILQGEDLGVSFDPVTRDLIMKDFIEKTQREKGRAPGYMDYTRGYPPSQLITEDLLTELQKIGKKKGGAVHKAEGGDITGDDLIIEERPL